MGFQIVAGSGNSQPIGIFFERCKKSGKPAVFVAMFVRSRPDTELFHVIAHGSDATGVDSGRIAQIGDDVFDLAKGNEIAQRFLSRVKPHGLATVLGDVGAKEFLRLEASSEEVNVINKRVGDTSGGKRGGKLWLPNALGEPSAGRQLAKVLLQVGGQASNLFVLIFGRNRDQNGLVETATDEFHLAGLDQIFQAGKILRPMFLNPGEERPGIVEAEMNLRMLFKVLDEWKIG